MPPVIQHDRTAHRFHTRVDGIEGVLDYTLGAGVMTITHTAVPSAIGGRGIAAALTRAAMAAARAEAWKVVPACSYAARWMQRHPEYHDLLA
ncbi:GNAT family N-acetyltransferase [Rhodanobacter sp. T12-5]|uniref:GNAT family N-acetyltransferase n=1 Tax=Rhodanobacter sp. T12-5 TaxID=2024611 RepID=UPI0011ED5415|nr:GNAT family N-acetyltransferase [Rhodanobacter sp. T12-5]KAA0070163.1 N-acetyltransferase [Rhodanobacter sp. T12-5]